MGSDEYFAPDLVLPSQWLRPGRLCPCGCQRLMLEVLADAFLTLVRPPPGHHKGHGRALGDVAAWFQQPFRSAPVNLSDCCDALNLDIGWVQAVALRLARRAASDAPIGAAVDRNTPPAGVAGKKPHALISPKLGPRDCGCRSHRALDPASSPTSEIDPGASGFAFPVTCPCSSFDIGGT